MSDEVMVMYLGQVVEKGPVDRIFNHAAHPYTQALLSAIPSMDPNQRTLKPPLDGDPPNPINPPSGCRFQDRCLKVMNKCRAVSPSLTFVGLGSEHTVACHLNEVTQL